MSQPVQRSVAITLAIGFVFACVLGLIALGQYRQFQSDLQWTDHSYKVLSRIDDIDRGLLNAETSERGYLLTSRAEYLQPYQAGSELATRSINELEQLTVDNPLQRASLQQLRPIIEEKLALMVKVIAVHDAQGTQAAIAVVLQGAGRNQMGRVQQLTRTMRQREQALLQLRVQNRETSSHKAVYLIACGLLAYLLVLLAAFSMIRSTLAQRHAAEEAAFRARELAEVTLHSIGDGVLITDVAGTVTDMNAAAEAIIGSSRASLRGFAVGHVLNFIHRHSRQPIENPVYAALSAQRTIELEPDAILIRKDGVEVGVEDSAAPIRNQLGKVIGCVLVFRDVTERRSLADKIANLALYDALTGLANRSLLENRLQLAIEQAIRHGDKVGLIFMDLDRFKAVNDTLGHAAGDALLKEVAARLAKTLRASDTACRVGGDEFIALLPGIASGAAALQVAEKIHAAAEPPAQIDGKAVPIRFSAGVAVYPDDAVDGTELMRTADARMYQAKRNRDR